MIETTARLALPLLAPGQAQKEVTHNEALTAIDALLQGIVEAVGVNAPPATPPLGASWIVGPAPTAAWAGRGGHVASWTAGGWRFQPPLEGMALAVRGSRFPARRTAAGWEQPSPATAVPNPTGGTTVDAEARGALTAVLDALRSNGLIAS